jgi:hypothetical protein
LAAATGEQRAGWQKLVTNFDLLRHLAELDAKVVALELKSRMLHEEYLRLQNGDDKAAAEKAQNDYNAASAELASVRPERLQARAAVAALK